MSSPTHYDAIQDLVPNAEVGVTTKGDQVTIHWQDEREQPTDEAIQAKLAELQSEYNALQYQRDRAEQYPAIGDQLDMLFHAIDAGTLDKSSDFYTTLKAVKDKYPKG